MKGGVESERNRGIGLIAPARGRNEEKKIERRGTSVHKASLCVKCGGTLYTTVLYDLAERNAYCAGLCATC